LAWRGKAGRGLARQGTAGTVWHGKARFGKAR